MVQFHINERIITDKKQIGTIKYVGPIPQWNVIALGVEWDDPKNGKNNGILNGIHYFKPRVPQSGSFIKSTSKKIESTKISFVGVISNEYLNTKYEQSDIKFGRKNVQEFGWQELNEKQSNLENLKSLTLDYKFISKIFEINNDEEIQMLKSLSKLENLELSCNLFEDIKEVWILLDCLTSLKTLNINGNRFGITENLPNMNSHVTSLHLASCIIDIPYLNKLLNKFPNLQNLNIANNHYNDSEILKLKLPNNITKLDLSGNTLNNIPEFENLKNLNLANNNIMVSKLLVSNKYEALDLRGNKISSWTEIDLLSNCLQSLKEFRVNHNPLFDIMTIDEMTVQLIGRFRCGLNDLYKLNGSFLTEDEIENANLYINSKIQGGEIKVNNNLKLQKQFNYKNPKLHDSHDFPWLNLNFVLPETGTFNEKFLKTTSVLKLKGYVSRKLNNLSILKFEIQSKSNDDINNHRLENNLSTIKDYSLENNQTLYINFV
ncbi:unnamed protein product [Candida verbasci]|uniref:CAP-Gly domain-containing protein n=1 Tax=Candida verbasci TaxID=1227364 RepID=A0A9W4XHX4_9ASCO|nr:unnamed protein product [Candida verbasci]